MDTKTIRGLYNLRQKDLARIFGVPIRTVQNWDLRGTMPVYVGDMMEFILERCQVDQDPLGDPEDRVREIRKMYEG